MNGKVQEFAREIRRDYREEEKFTGRFHASESLFKEEKFFTQTKNRKKNAKANRFGTCLPASAGELPCNMVGSLVTLPRF
ncbi:hypothetical protein [Noviherbaspirillum agri]